MKKIISMFLAMAMVLSLCACGSEPAKTTEAPAPSATTTQAQPTEKTTEAVKQQYDLIAGAGNAGSAGNSLISAICQIIQENVSNVTMTPSDTNSGACPEAIQMDVCQAGQTTSANMVDAMKGEGDYSQVCDKPMQMLYLYETPMHLFMREDDHINDFTDLKGQPIGSLVAGSFATVIVDKLLPYYGMSWDSFSQVHTGTGSETIGMLKNRQIKLTFAANAILTILPLTFSLLLRWR